MQTVTHTYDSIGGVISHYIAAYDEKGELIDIIEIDERQGCVIECKSILE